MTEPRMTITDDHVELGARIAWNSYDGRTWEKTQHELKDRERRAMRLALEAVVGAWSPESAASDESVEFQGKWLSPLAAMKLTDEVTSLRAILATPDTWPASDHAELRRVFVTAAATCLPTEVLIAIAGWVIRHQARDLPAKGADRPGSYRADLADALAGAIERHGAGPDSAVVAFFRAFVGAERRIEARLAAAVGGSGPKP